MEEAFKIATFKTYGVHISYDLDVIDPEIAPGVSVPEEDGLNEDGSFGTSSCSSDSCRNFCGQEPDQCSRGNSGKQQDRGVGEQIDAARQPEGDGKLSGIVGNSAGNADHRKMHLFFCRTD